jgi:hypothetical protein
MSPVETNGSNGAESPFDEVRLAEIARGLADQFAILYEEKPVDPRAHMAGNMLTFAFQGGLSRADELHLEHGHGEELRAFRECFLQVVSGRFQGLVESLSGGHVTFSSGVFDPESRTTNMLFVLDLLPDDKAEQRAAIRNWSEQVRRNARELRIGHLQTRETHMALRDQLQDVRLANRAEREAGAEDAAGSEGT